MLTTILSSEIFILCLSLIFLSGAYLFLNSLKKKFNISPELSRKAIHIGLGLFTLCFPWLFKETFTVWSMGIISVVALLGLRFNKLKTTLGDSLHGVERHSYGEIFFPISVAVLFQLSHQTPVFYVVSILVLTLADSLAAIIGVYYGKAHYNAAEGIKSVEGSLFFFITAFLCIQTPLLLMSDYSNANIILVAFFIAAIITLCEAVAWQGLDNLFIPLGVYVALTNYLDFPVYMLIAFIIIFIAIMGLSLYLRNKSSMNLSALLFSIVLGFIYTTLDPLSFIIPLSMFFLYLYISRKEQKYLKDAHTVLTILYLNLGGLFWIFLRNNGYPDLTIEFSVYYCMQIGIISWIHQYLFNKKNNLFIPFINALILFSAIFIIYSHRIELFTLQNYWVYSGFLILSLLTGLVIFKFWSKKYDLLPVNRERLCVQGGSAFIGSLIFYICRSLYA